MAFELSFSEEFFDIARAALESMPDSEWKAMVEDCFPDCDPEYVEIHTVMDLIRETNTCTDLSAPVSVWIDSEGYHTVSVGEG